MQAIRKLFIGLMAGVLFAGPSVAQNVVIPKPKPPVLSMAPSVEAEFQVKTGAGLRAELNLSGVSGWLVVDLQTGEVLDSANADRPFVPASVAKLPTAAFALDALGPEYRFETRLLAGGPIAAGRLDGDLILSGGGNPELDTDALAVLAQQLAARGVRQVAGGLIADGSALPQLAQIETTQGDDSSYNPSVSGLNLNFNRVHLKWDARGGRNFLSVEAASERRSPPVDGVRVALASNGDGPLFTFSDANGREEWRMSRRAFKGQAARWLPVKRPEAYAAEVFQDLAREHGIAIGPARVAAAIGGGTVLASHESRPLGEIVRSMLRYSVNLTAEVTGTAATRSVGAAVNGLPDSAAVMNTWAATVAGFPVGDPGFRFANHSGLTTDSKVSPRRMVDLLIAFSRRTPAPSARHPAIPGAIAGYLRPHDVSAKTVPMDYGNLEVVAKTGTMSYIRGLAGYISTPTGRKLAFAIFSNDLDARGDGAQRVNQNWMGRAQGFERALIRNWVLSADGKGS